MNRDYNKDECRAACETTANMWRTTYAAFESAGIEIQLGNTSKMRYISVTGKKTDKVDVEKMAHLLRMDMIPKCHVPSAHVRMIRSTIRQRITMVQDRTRTINRIHSLLDAHGVQFFAYKLYSKKSIDRLESVRFSNRSDTMILQRYINK